MQLNQRDRTESTPSQMRSRDRDLMSDIQGMKSQLRMLHQPSTPYRGISKLLVCAAILLTPLGLGTNVNAYSLPLIRSQESSPPPRSMVTVEGVVKDDHGGTLPKARIVFKLRNRIIKRVESNESGAFTIDLPAAIYSVVAKSDGCRDFHQKNVKVVAAHTPMLSITVKCSPTPIFE